MDSGNEVNKGCVVVANLKIANKDININHLFRTKLEHLAEIIIKSAEESLGIVLKTGKNFFFEVNMPFFSMGYEDLCLELGFADELAINAPLGKKKVGASQMEALIKTRFFEVLGSIGMRNFTMAVDSKIIPGIKKDPAVVELEIEQDVTEPERMIQKRVSAMN